MSEATIQVPAEHVEAIRQGLIGLRSDAGHAGAIDGLLSQIASGATSAQTLTGPRSVLWSAVYDSLCAAAEQLADDCNDYWRGAVDLAAARAGVTAVAARLELLVALGAPPGARGR